MTDRTVDAGGSTDPAPEADRPRSGSVTRGFLFADLRGYTSFVERNGAAAAAELLSRYRVLVRAVIERFDGAEIRTEGDSFYVVFSSVSAAVQAGLAIVADAAAGNGSSDPIAVGVGVHAGETVETSEGYVGTPVNIAARLCSIAAAGQVLVSDTVRALTQTVLPVRFRSLGRRTLKGVSDPVAVYEVVAVGPGSSWASSNRPASRRRWFAIGAVGVAVAVVSAVGAWATLGHRTGLPPGPWKIGDDMPLSGDIASRGAPLLKAVQLAVDQANAAGGIGGAQIVVEQRDHANPDLPNGQDPAKGVANMQAFIADPTVIGVVGPTASGVAKAEIPVTNQAGLLQCSPTTTAPGLTKPRNGALDLRSANPDGINYVRLATTDDMQGPASASFAFNDLSARRVLVIDDAGDGRDIADAFQQAFTALGGKATRLAFNPGSDPKAVLGSLDAASDTPQLVFFGGFTETGAADIRKAMVAGGHAAIPFQSWDGIIGPGDDPNSFIHLAGAAAAGSYMSQVTIAPVKADFASRYRASTGTAADAFDAAAYACTEVMLESLRQVATSGPTADHVRGSVRAWATDPTHRFDTALGSVAFDKNGDSVNQYVTLLGVDPTADGGAGDWVIAKQQDFGPAP